MLLYEIATTSRELASTSARLGKIERLAACLGRAEVAEVPVAVAYLSGALPQRQIGVGYAALRDRPAPATEASLTVGEVDTALTTIGRVSGAGSGAERRRRLAELFARATEPEQAFLVGLLTGELRQGALDGVMADAVASASKVPAAEVRRALMLRGSLGAVAQAALRDGLAGVRSFTLQVGQPVLPMLARTADSVTAALERIRPAVFEWKLDGVRIQAHRSGSDVRVFTRTLDEITGRVPEVIEAVRALPVRAAVLDGEVIALQADGRPHPFQVTAGRVGSRSDAEELRRSVPLTPFLFDVLHLDGEDLLDHPYDDRHAALAAITSAGLRPPRVVTGDADTATGFFRDALEHGHEGVVAKSPQAPYAAGRRGAGWLKVKPRHTLDLVVLAAEWGHGRRRGWLSNLHLGARRGDGSGYVMLGKTFKGMTDAMLTWQTERLLELESSRDSWTVRVRPELVVEVAFDGLQRSSRYPGGLALRFARVLRYRADKRAEDADTFETVQAIAAGSG